MRYQYFRLGVLHGTFQRSSIPIYILFTHLFIPSDFRFRIAYILGVKRRLVIRYGGGGYNAFYNDLDVRLAKETVSLLIIPFNKDNRIKKAYRIATVCFLCFEKFIAQSKAQKGRR
jgi:hypothetical protein